MENTTHRSIEGFGKVRMNQEEWDELNKQNELNYTQNEKKINMTQGKNDSTFGRHNVYKPNRLFKSDKLIVTMTKRHIFKLDIL